MGIDISSKLLVGRYAEDILEDKELDEDINEVEYLENIGLEYSSEHYDCDPLESAWGIEIQGGLSVEETVAAIKEAEADFFNLTGLIPRVYQLPDVT